ncbi:MAG: MFS transporter [Burkholderiaceae bacterium]
MRADAEPLPDNSRGAWPMLAVLIIGFTLSQAFRTVAAITAPPLQQELGLSISQLGSFAGAFHLAFALMQPVVGVSFDSFGVRRTVLVLFPMMVVGSVVIALGTNLSTLIAGQILVGVGSAPAFVACTMLIAERFPPASFASVSSLVLGIGGVGMLLTGTPLAWLIDYGSWRSGFWTLAVASAITCVVVYRKIHDSHPPHADPDAPRETLVQSFAAFGRLFLLPQTIGIVVLSLVTYSSFMTLRGLWLGPFMVDRFGLTLSESGSVAFWMSAAAVVGLPLFGYLDPGGRQRRVMMIALTLLFAALFVALALAPNASFAVALILAIGVLSGYGALHYPDARESYSPQMTGRAIALMTMTMFGSIAIVQWLTGIVANHATAWGVENYLAIYVAIAVLLVAGALAFALLPWPDYARRRPRGVA